MFGMAMPFALQQLIGGQQVGQAAPPPQLGAPQAPLGAKEATDALIRRQMQGPPPQQPQMAPPNLPPQMGPPSPQDDPLSQPQGIMGKIGGFGRGIDSTLQSPSKMLGIGALSEINPYLGMGGLLAGGLFGGRRGH
jgi:hypothetical protein